MKFRKILAPAYVHRLKRCNLENREKLLAFLSGKSIAVVGNAQSLFGRNSGADIDRHDIVLRMNRGFIQCNASQGSRTDLLAFSCHLSLQQIRREFDPQFLMWMGRDYRHFPLFIQEYEKRVYFYEPELWREDANRVSSQKPSAGYMVTSFLRNLSPESSLSLFGFDFGKTRTFYNKPGYTPPHNFPAEMLAITQLENAGLVAIH